MKNIENLFVYGTLQKGKQHQSILGKIKGKWKKGYVNGTLYNISSGPDYGYPGLKLDPKGLKIYGMIFQSKNLENYIKKIIMKEVEHLFYYQREIYLKKLELINQLFLEHFQKNLEAKY